MAFIEHVNITVSNPVKTAEVLATLFGWRIRWQGKSQLGGDTIHVGNDDHYIAVYGQADRDEMTPLDHKKGAPLNHIGIVVDDLDALESRVLAAGFKTFSHDDYEPGRRFYFFDTDGIEFEAISYTR